MQDANSSWYLEMECDNNVIGAKVKIFTGEQIKTLFTNIKVNLP